MDLNIFISAFAIIAGLAGLYYGGEFLVDGASALAKRLGISALVIGITIVGFGTSTPELAVSVLSAMKGNAGISLGNVVGSNIFNSFLILGVATMLAVIPNQSKRFVRDAIVMLAAYAVTTAFILLPVIQQERGLDFIEGVIMIALLVGYLVYLFATAKREPSLEDESDEAPVKKPISIPLSLLKIVGGIVILVLASEFLIRGSTYLARLAGVSDRFIGLTIAAIGTSLPELVTSLVAARKNEMDISVGNILGSNIFNILFIAGIAAAITPLAGSANYLPVASSGLIDFGVLLVSAAILLGVIALTKKIGKAIGVPFVLLYAAYFAYVLISAKA